MAILFGKVYKLESDDTEQVYVGSTTQELDERFNDHVQKLKCFTSGSSDQWYSSFELMQHADVSIVLLEDVQCADLEELRKREQYHIDDNDSVNVCKAHCTAEDLLLYHKAWRARNREQINAANRRRYAANPEKYKAACTKWRNEHREEINQKYRDTYDSAKNVAKVMKYRATHKEQVNKYKRELYQKKKDQMLAKTACGCGGSFDSTHKSRHIKSARHVKWAQAQKD